MVLPKIHAVAPLRLCALWYLNAVAGVGGYLLAAKG